MTSFFLHEYDSVDNNISVAYECGILACPISVTFMANERTTFEFNMSFDMEKIDKMFKLQHHFLWDSQ